MKDALDLYIDSVEHLPAAPIVMVRLISLFRQSDRDVDEVVQLMSQDPSLTAEVLKRCNRADVGAGEPVVDIFDAVMRLGFYEVYQTTVTMLGSQTIQGAHTNNAIRADELWRHSVLAAAAAGKIAKLVGESEGIAYTAALLHDIGKIVLASAEGTKYAALRKTVGRNGRPLEDAETGLFGFGHGAIGARLLNQWGVPLEVSMPVFGHHIPDETEKFQQLSAIVSLADFVAHRFDDGADDQPWNPVDFVPSTSLLNWQEGQVTALAESVREDLAQLEQDFGAAMHA